jgi:hypothetical protein
MQRDVSQLYDMPYYQNPLFKASIIKSEAKAFEMVKFLVQKGCKANYVDFLK